MDQAINHGGCRHLLRKYLAPPLKLENGVLVNVGDALPLSFSTDHEFTSPSTAAPIVCGHSMNGRAAWKTNEGITLKAIQEAHLVTTVPAHA